ncbi:MAG: type I phosphomannose isomerase catalytic subunit [Phycisphaerae bacterium]
MYPLKFTPVFQERLWGGTRLKGILNKSLPAHLDGKPIGESWELSDLPPGTVKADSAGAAADGSLSSIIANGPWKGKTLAGILGEFGQEIMGAAPLLHGRFPLLIKFLDAQSDLSVQVHPDAAYCAQHPDAHLKSESWYVLHAEPGAKVYRGLKPGVTKERFAQALKEEGGAGVADLLQAFKVRAGDCFYLESGTVHALGAGILAAEVQTPSDTTFRVFDWNRLGPDGKPRQLHVAQALEAITFSSPSDPTGIFAAGTPAAGGVRSHVAGVFVTVSRLVTCPYFTLERVRMSQEYQQDIPYAEPVVWMVLEGQGVITCDGGGGGPTAFAKGDTMLLPANLKNAKVKAVTDVAWLEAKIPPGN